MSESVTELDTILAETDPQKGARRARQAKAQAEALVLEAEALLGF
jgi:hypothetical protein